MKRWNVYVYRVSKVRYMKLRAKTLSEALDKARALTLATRGRWSKPKHKHVAHGFDDKPSNALLARRTR